RTSTGQDLPACQPVSHHGTSPATTPGATTRNTTLPVTAVSFRIGPPAKSLSRTRLRSQRHAHQRDPGLLSLSMALRVPGGRQGRGQNLSGLLGVFAAAEAFGLAVADAPVVMHGHRCLLAGGDRPVGPPDEQVDVVVPSGEAVRVELGDLDAVREVAEEAGYAGLAGSRPVPRRGAAGGLGRPVDVVGDAVQDGGHVAAADRGV